MDICGSLFASGNIQIPAARRTGADKNGIVFFGEHGFHTFDARPGTEFSAEVEYVIDFLINHRFGQAKARNLRTYHAAGTCIAVMDDNVIAERQKIARDGKRGGSGTDAGDTFAVFLPCRLGQAIANVLLQIGSDALQAADRDRFRFCVNTGRAGLAGAIVFLHASASAGGFAGTITGAPKNSWKDVRLPVDHIGIAVAPGGNHANVLWNGGVGRARPLTIYYLVEVVRLTYISRFHWHFSLLASGVAARRVRRVLQVGVNPAMRRCSIAFRW